MRSIDRQALLHEELCRSDDGTDVTSVALRHGFAHLGRFSAYYQSTFDEPPSATLRRRRSMTASKRRQGG